MIRINVNRLTPTARVHEIRTTNIVVYEIDIWAVNGAATRRVKKPLLWLSYYSNENASIILVDHDMAGYPPDRSNNVLRQYNGFRELANTLSVMTGDGFIWWLHKYTSLTSTRPSVGYNQRFEVFWDQICAAIDWTSIPLWSRICPTPYCYFWLGATHSCTWLLRRYRIHQSSATEPGIRTGGEDEADTKWWWKWKITTSGGSRESEWKIAIIDFFHKDQEQRGQFGTSLLARVKLLEAVE